MLGFRLSDMYPVWITLSNIAGHQTNLDAGTIIDVKFWGTPIIGCAKPTLVVCSNGGVFVTETPDQVAAIIRKAVARG